jgi:hypothetical protein
MDRRPNTVRITSEILPTGRVETLGIPAADDRHRRGRRRFSTWRERPHPWPRAWHAKRSFQMVAHATVLLLTTAPGAAPAGGRHRAPPGDDGLQPERRWAVAGYAHRASVGFTDMKESSEHRCRKGNTLREALFPSLFPPPSDRVALVISAVATTRL